MAEPLKNIYDHEFVERLAAILDQHAPNGIDQASFIASVFADGWKDLELKARMRRISKSIRTALPEDYLAALPIVRNAATDFQGYMSLFFPDFVEQYGMDHWQPSIDALHWMTRFGSSEFAVRPFLIADPPRMVAEMIAWTRDENEHVRRLASEGCRPLLPWGMNLPVFQKDPLPLMPILEVLRDDESEYVRRSVANNLNDIAKDHPTLVLKTAEAWLGHSAPVDKLVKHACRTLLKNGDAKAMRLFGFRDPADVQLEGFQIAKESVPLGGDLEFTFCLRSGAPLGKLRLEYRLDFARPHGRGATKVFKISESESKSSERIVQRRHSFIDRSTRKHYVGEHKLTVIINGVAKESMLFDVVD
jgi:3-methyladenine DNA glycosylase AlkC